MDNTQQRTSSRITNGSIGWIDNVPCLPVSAIIDDLLQTENDWNLYVCPERNVRHSFVVHKHHGHKSFYFYDYQGTRIFLNQNFSTTRVYNALKIDKSHNFKVKLGQKHCIVGTENSHLCLKNSAFVMKYKCAPQDKHFNTPYDKDRDLYTGGRILIDLTNL